MLNISKLTKVDPKNIYQNQNVRKTALATPKIQQYKNRIQLCTSKYFFVFSLWEKNMREHVEEKPSKNHKNKAKKFFFSQHNHEV